MRVMCQAWEPFSLTLRAVRMSTDNRTFEPLAASHNWLGKNFTAPTLLLVRKVSSR
jgi:hypothetical protein